MELTFLGSGACFYPALHNTSAYFEYDNNLLLLDCGETVYERLLEKKDISKYDQIYVLITHLHADHVGSLGSLLSYCSCILKKRIHIIYPHDSVCKLLTLMGIMDSFYFYHPSLPDTLDGLDVKAIPVRHAENMKCFGYEIKCRDWHIYYSGDASDIPPDILLKFNSGEIRKIYQDTSSYRTDHHMFIGDLEKAVPSALRHNVVCMHLDRDCRKELTEKGFQIPE